MELKNLFLKFFFSFFNNLFNLFKWSRNLADQVIISGNKLYTEQNVAQKFVYDCYPSS